MHEDTNTPGAEGQRAQFLSPLRLYVGGVRGEEVPLGEASDAANQCLLHVGNVFNLLAMLSAHRLRLFGEESATSMLISLAELCIPLLGEASTQLERIDDERRELERALEGPRAAAQSEDDKAKFRDLLKSRAFLEGDNLERVAYILGRTRVISYDLCELTDDDAMLLLREVLCAGGEGGTDERS